MANSASRHLRPALPGHTLPGMIRNHTPSLSWPSKSVTCAGPTGHRSRARRQLRRHAGRGVCLLDPTAPARRPSSDPGGLPDPDRRRRERAGDRPATERVSYASGWGSCCRVRVQPDLSVASGRDVRPLLRPPPAGRRAARVGRADEKRDTPPSSSPRPARRWTWPWRSSANPDLIFLDEPTTGFDRRPAARPGRP